MDDDKRNEFADLVAKSPSAQEAASAKYVRVIGVLLRSDNKDNFHLALPGGETVEIPIKAVEDYDPVDRIGNQHLVKMTVLTDELSASANAMLLPTLGITPTLFTQRTGTTRVEGD